MEPVEYVAPGGAVQLVEDPATMYRLQAAGWRPRPELETLAGADDEAAREHLERATAYERQQLAEQEVREARFAPRPKAKDGDPEREANKEKPPKPRTPRPKE
ncbi:hypothetical protein ACFY1J_24025 [Streptomyces sp. NPDC001406]|uniref:hypothetical protein n=1 Tax=Streptomyces sp. NPDC001406 TaxID=3364572 RepID=UPI0036A16A5D